MTVPVEPRRPLAAASWRPRRGAIQLAIAAILMECLIREVHRAVELLEDDEPE